MKSDNKYKLGKHFFFSSLGVREKEPQSYSKSKT